MNIKENINSIYILNKFKNILSKHSCNINLMIIIVAKYILVALQHTYLENRENRQMKMIPKRVNTKSIVRNFPE